MHSYKLPNECKMGCILWNHTNNTLATVTIQYVADKWMVHKGKDTDEGEKKAKVSKEVNKSVLE